MAKFALLLPREEMVQPAGRIARELGLEVVYNRSATTDRILELAEESGRLGADIIVARGRQASIIKENTDFPVVEIRLTGQEIALSLRRAKDMVPQIQRPRIGIVTLPNMIGDVRCFEEVLDIELRTYFCHRTDEMQGCVEQAMADGMNVILGGDYVNACCRRLGKRTLFFESTDDSLRTSLQQAKNLGFATDTEQRNTAHLQVLLDYSFNGILELNDQGVILRVNDVACKILGKAREELVGQSLSELMPDTDAELWSWTLRERQELFSSLLEVAGVEVVANAAPVGGRSSAAGIVFSFYEMRRVERQEAHALQERYRLQRYQARGRFEDLAHKSREMDGLVKLARTFADTDEPVLIQGEVGVGKCLLAQGIHNASRHASRPFVTFDCGAGEEDQAERLAQSILSADLGTLYLEHANKLTAAAQHALTRLLQEGVVLAMDGSGPAPVSVRVITSLTTPLHTCMTAGLFQPKLYYMLFALQLNIPPLRTRLDDLDQAISLFLDRCVSKFNRYVVPTQEARQLLLHSAWPGNYLQLRAFLERMVLTAPARTVGAGYVRSLLSQLNAAGSEVLTQAPPPVCTDEPEAEQIMDILLSCGGNRAAAAQRLGISKTTLWRRMKQYGINMK